VTFSGALAWPYLYSWPPRPAGLIETAFDELGQALAADPGRVRPCMAWTSRYEVHPGEDLHDGVSYEMFLDRVHGHKRACLLLRPQPLRAAAA
jgi:hypothetical protein